jgi:hypothetical protein
VVSKEDLKRIDEGQSISKHLDNIDKLALLAIGMQQRIEDEVFQHDVEPIGSFDGSFKQLVQ